MLAFDKSWFRWSFAAVLTLLSAAANWLLQPLLGGRAPMLPFFPALVVIGFLAGLWPAIAALCISALLMVTWSMAPIGTPWAIADTADRVLLATFLVTGLLAVAATSSARGWLEGYRRTRRRLDMTLSVGRMTTWEWEPASGRVTLAQGAEAVFGTRWDRIEGAWPLVHEDDRERVTAQMQAALHGTVAQYSFVSRVKRPDTGETRWIETHGHVLRNAKGEARRVTGVSIDVDERQRALDASRAAEERFEVTLTEVRSAQEALQREVQRKDNFLATLAHELRNPMAPIRYAAAMLGQEATAATQAHARQVIERQSAHMSRLLDDLLDVSRITRNAIELQRTRLDLRTVVAQAVETTQGAVTERRHRLAVDLPDDPLWVQGDATRLLQVLSNLLDNAVKYTAPGGELRLTLRREGTQAVLAVRDSGEGLSAEALGTVFELFSRVPHKQRHDPGGLGIGLAVVKQLVELHGGSVRADSAGPGQGSIFSVRLPLDLRPAAPLTATGPAPAVVSLGRGCAVLVVDDNVDAADMLASALRLDGYAVSVAYDGETALQALATIRPAAVLLDIGLPDLSGHEVARRIRQAPGTPPKLIAISGWGQARDLQLTREAGFDVHLVKPVEPARVHEALQSLLGPSDEAAAG